MQVSLLERAGPLATLTWLPSANISVTHTIILISVVRHIESVGYCKPLTLQTVKHPE